MRLRLVADRIIPMDGRSPTSDAGAVDIDDDRIVWSGPVAEAPQDADRTAFRLRGVLMPGMVNAHAHTPMVLVRSLGEGLPVDRWLTEVIWPREARLTPGDVEAGMTQGLLEELANGITTTAEMYFHADAMARAVDTVGSRALLTGPVIDDAQLEVFGDPDQQIEECIELQQRWQTHPRIDIGIGPHAAYSLGERSLRAVATAAVEHGLFVHTHVAEGRHEGDSITARTGRSVPSYLEDIGLLDASVIAAHCVWVDDDDIRILADHRVGVAHCPCSNSKHASGVAPVSDMRAAGLPVAIATDGPSSHARLDLFEEMRQAVRMARIRAHDATSLTASEALAMVTSEAADAIGRPDLGRLSPGCKADLVLVDTDRSEFAPLNGGGTEEELVAQIVWSGSPAAVRSVWVDGRRLIDDGRHVEIDVRSAVAEANGRARRLAIGA